MSLVLRYLESVISIEAWPVYQTAAQDAAAVQVHVHMRQLPGSGWTECLRMWSRVYTVCLDNRPVETPVSAPKIIGHNFIMTYQICFVFQLSQN